MRLILAPLEGVLDARLRQVLIAINDYDLCITEFLRVTNTCYTPKVFYRNFPELSNQYQAKTLIRIQLLGQDPNWLAQNAKMAVDLGSFGVDFNCGCPSKTVNGSGGGASLLKDLNLIYKCVKAMRQAIPKEFPLSVKMRLGWDNAESAVDIAHVIEDAGADELTVHGRTKEDRLESDKINWDAIYNIKQKVSIPVIANGDIFSYEDAKRCLQVTETDGLMVGRGALMIPNFSYVVKNNASIVPWDYVLEVLRDYLRLATVSDNELYYSRRIKQLLGYLRHTYPEASLLFQQVRCLQKTADFISILE